jgi:hypothetical protein
VRLGFRHPGQPREPCSMCKRMGYKRSAKKPAAPSRSAAKRRRFPWRFALFLSGASRSMYLPLSFPIPETACSIGVRRSVGTASVTTRGSRTWGCGPIPGSPTRCSCARTTGRSRTPTRRPRWCPQDKLSSLSAETKLEIFLQVTAGRSAGSRRRPSSWRSHGETSMMACKVRFRQ